jgi:hypothetical protein
MFSAIAALKLCSFFENASVKRASRLQWVAAINCEVGSLLGSTSTSNMSMQLENAPPKFQIKALPPIGFAARSIA